MSACISGLPPSENTFYDTLLTGLPPSFLPLFLSRSPFCLHHSLPPPSLPMRPPSPFLPPHISSLCTISLATFGSAECRPVIACPHVSSSSYVIACPRPGERAREKEREERERKREREREGTYRQQQRKYRCLVERAQRFSPCPATCTCQHALGKHPLTA